MLADSTTRGLDAIPVSLNVVGKAERPFVALAAILSPSNRA